MAKSPSVRVLVNQLKSPSVNKTQPPIEIVEDVDCDNSGNTLYFFI